MATPRLASRGRLLLAALLAGTAVGVQVPAAHCGAVVFGRPSAAPARLPAGAAPQMGVARKRQEQQAAGLGKPKGKGKAKGKAKGGGGGGGFGSRADSSASTSDASASVMPDAAAAADGAADGAASTSGEYQGMTPDPEKLLNDDPTAAIASTDSTPTASPAGCEPVFALQSDALLTSVRVGTLAAPPTYEAVLAALEAVGPSDEEMTTFMQVNRDLLDFRFLYRLTADKMLAENTGDAAAAERLNAARKRAVVAAQRFDQPLFKELNAAEERLGKVLTLYMQGTQPSARDIVDAAGVTPPQVYAFWMVTVAAMAAWERNLPIASVANQAQQKLGELGQIRDAFEAVPELTDACGLTPLLPLFNLPDLSLAAASGSLAPATVESAKQKLREIESDEQRALAYVRRIGCTYCQAQRHGFQAYNPLVQRSAALADVLLYGRIVPLEARDIQSPPREVSSRMVQIANDADEAMRQANIEIPLYW